MPVCQPSSETGRFSNEQRQVFERSGLLQHAWRGVIVAAPETELAQSPVQRQEAAPTTGAKILQFTAREEALAPATEIQAEPATTTDLSIETIRANVADSFKEAA